MPFIDLGFCVPAKYTDFSLPTVFEKLSKFFSWFFSWYFQENAMPFLLLTCIIMKFIDNEGQAVLIVNNDRKKL